MKQYLDKLDKILEEYLVKKAPVLPDNFKKFLVQIAPWFAVIATVLGIPALLAVFGLGAMVTPFALVAGGRTGSFWFFWLIAGIQVVLSAMSIRPLFDKKMKGWQLIFYSQLLSLVIAFQYMSLFSLVTTIVSWYLLYQVKSRYR